MFSKDWLNLMKGYADDVTALANECVCLRFRAIICCDTLHAALRVVFRMKMMCISVGLNDRNLELP